MIPKYRAFWKSEKKMITNDQIIIWNNNVYVNDRGKLKPDRLMGWSIDDKYLMQSTGLFDKKDVEIYEGDVIDWFYWDNFEQKGRAWITYENAMFVLRDVKTGEVVWDSLFDCSENCEVYVVGNIYENPDLLEGLNGG